MNVEGITVRFGGVVALEDVTFEARAGEVLGVIGPNGAGKTTLFNVIGGVQPPSAGRVVLDGNVLTALPVHRIAALGVTRTFQTPVMFWGLTVRESIVVALAARHRRVERALIPAGLGLPGERAELERLGRDADALLAGTPLEAHVASPTESLSFGQERMLEILRALAIEPRVLLLDEPLSGLSGDEIARVLALVRSARERGVCVLFVEHDLANLLAAADRFVVLDHGKKIAEGIPDAIVNDPIVLDAYIGDEIVA
ncbi:MAG: ABC transporter ATP-binding protein [Candidatus Eremiobacteraeota bacterium]|nr:ABC transporter ATP-binding protein [Candidatus Eremiobacteraeota bacterium]